MEESAKRFTTGIVTGIVALGTAIGVGLYALYLLQSSPTPASYLPAKSVVAYFAHVESKDLQSYKPWFPSLTTLAEFHVPVTLALLDEGGKEQWIVFPEDANGHMIETEVQSSIPQVELLLKDKNQEKLSSQKAFSLLSREAPTNAPWAFVDLRRHLPQKTVDSMLLSTMSTSPYALFTSNGAEQSMTVPVSAPFAAPSVPESLPQIFTTPLVSAAFSSPEFFLDHLIQALPEEKQDIAWGFLSAFFKQRVGQTVLLKEDILPLLEEPGTVFVGKRMSSGGALPFVYQGRMNGRTLSGSLATLRGSFRSSLPKISVTRHNFEQGFGTTIIQSDPEANKEVVTEQDGWTVQSLSSNGLQFVTAMKGNEFIVGNDTAAIEKLLSGKDIASTSTVLPSDTSSTLIAGGTMDLPFLRSFLQTMPVFALESTLFPSLEQKTGSVHWSLQKKGSLLTLTTRTQ